MFKTSSVLFVVTAVLLSISSAFDDIAFEPKVVQGEDATRGQFPFYVLLKIKMGNKTAACGGSLISSKWVVTAGHCLSGASGAEVILGSLRAADLNETGRVVIRVEKSGLHVHPRYFAPIVLNDISLIELPEEVQFSEVIQSVKLTCSTPKNLDVVVIGNGKTNTSETTLAPILQYADLQTVSLLQCLPDFPFLILRKSVLCVSSVQQKSACNGDSGGPLVSKETGALVGATSFGSPMGCHLGYPQGYTNIASYLDWIQEMTGITECQDPTY